MPKIVQQPQVIPAEGGKTIEEFAGNASTGDGGMSLARMAAPGGWQEPGQRPEFQEVTLVLRGLLRVEHEGGYLDVKGGQAVVAEPGEWVRYSCPQPEGAEYIAVCVPAFSPGTVHRDDQG